MLSRGVTMTLNNVHFAVRDLAAALAWLKEVWHAEATYADERMAAVPFGAFTVILDKADKDAPATLGFASRDCDVDYNAVVARGAVPLQAPADQPWGVRAAYLQGPGAIRFEIEQSLTEDAGA